jgi:hypothetical protein
MSWPASSPTRFARPLDHGIGAIKAATRDRCSRSS